MENKQGFFESVLSFFNLIAIGSGNVVSEQRQTGIFDSIVMDLPGNILIDAVESDNIRIETDDNLMDVIKTKVDGKRLTINSEGKLVHFTKLNVYLSAKVIREITLNGACTLTGNGKFTSDGLLINMNGAARAELDIDSKVIKTGINGAAKLNLNCNSDEIKISSSGASKISISGRTGLLNISSSGAGKISAFGLSADNAELSTFGASVCEINSSKTINASITGAGTVKYKGNPTVSSNISGAGQIKKASD